MIGPSHTLLLLEKNLSNYWSFTLLYIVDSTHVDLATNSYILHFNKFKKCMNSECPVIPNSPITLTKS